MRRNLNVTKFRYEWLVFLVYHAHTIRPHLGGVLLSTALLLKIINCLGPHYWGICQWGRDAFSAFTRKMSSLQYFCSCWKNYYHTSIFVNTNAIGTIIPPTLLLYRNVIRQFSIKANFCISKHDFKRWIIATFANLAPKMCLIAVFKQDKR